MNLLKSIAFFSILLVMNCQEKPDNMETHIYANDTHSYAQPNIAIITHLNLDIDVDFTTKTLKGSATYDIKHTDDASEIVLDSKFLNIKKVLADDVEANFRLGDFDSILGQSLHIDIDKKTKQVTVFYETTAETEALQWLNKQQTADQNYPFLFTQGQAILTRTWIPIQDSPQIRVSYEATVKVPSELMAVMSAENPKEKTKDGRYHFKMKQAISPYLIALAVGDLSYKPISKRTGVYAEKSMIDKVYNEFTDMEQMVSEAEQLYGDYAWEQFDVLVLPPSFPFGGMENPRLTFATPTVIAGDKSLTSLVAHELAHSWSGNLVTNATWDDFWLNEGFTVYIEMRIMEAVYGKERGEMLALISRQDLDDELEQLKEQPEATHLKLHLKGKNPDDGMNSIAYDKGYLFLRTLEETVGREKFDNFLKSYFKTHEFSSMNTEAFVEYLNANLLEPNGITFNTKAWIYNPGVPTNQSIVTSDKFDNVSQNLKTWLTPAATGTTHDYAVTKDWTPQEWVHFIRNFPKNISPEQMLSFDETFDLSNSTNSYIAMVWFEQSIKNNYHEHNVDAKIEEFLTHVGRRWYVETLFRAYKNADRTEEAIEIYKKARPNYHAVTAQTIDQLLKYKA